MHLITILFILLLLYYLCALFLLYMGLRKLSSPRHSYTPSISVIVSLHNEQINIPALLSALENQDYPQHLLEFICIDDRSEDKTLLLLREAQLKNKKLKIITISELHKDFAPKKRAIDTGISTSKGDIIVLTDADGRPGPQWLSTIVQYFDDNTGMVIGYAPYTSSDIISNILALEYCSHAVVAAATTGLGLPLTCVGTNLAYRKRVYMDLDGFGQFRHYHSGDDDLFMQRVRDESAWDIRYAFDPKCHVWNAPPATFRQFFNQRLRYASKGLFYPWKISSLLILTFLLNFLFVILFILGFSNPFFTELFFSGLAIKIIGEFTIMHSAKRKLGEKRRLWLMPILSLLHIPYVVFFALFSQLLKFQWAGRRK